MGVQGWRCDRKGIHTLGIGGGCVQWIDTGSIVLLRLARVGTNVDSRG